MPEVPPVLYKYCDPDRVDILENKWIRFSPPRALNDPFELVVQSDDLDTKIVNSTFEQAALLCMSSKWDNIMMWSHYAKSHKGFVIGLNTNSEFFAQCRPGKVWYRKQKANINMGDTLEGGVLTKYDAWTYEQEWRSYRVPEFDAPQFRLHPDIDLYMLYPNTIAEVTIGCLTDESIRRRILRALNHDWYRGVSKYAVTQGDGFTLERTVWTDKVCTCCQDSGIL